MSRWFRHYGGLARDEKLVSAAVKSRQPVERVIWVWTAILESASEVNDNGRYNFDTGEAAYFLRCDEADLVGVLTSLESLGRLCDGVVVRWGDRQYSSDSAAERQRRYRERKSAGAGIRKENSDDNRNGDGLVASRDADVTPQDTDTDTDTDKKVILSPQAAPKPKNGSRLSDDWVLPKAWGNWALENIAGATIETVRSQADQFRDYWVGKAGAAARKADWEATWRNWMRNAKPPSRSPPQPIAGKPRNIAEASTQLLAQMRAENANTQPGTSHSLLEPNVPRLAAPIRQFGPE